jgi:hypothetical protein
MIAAIAIEHGLAIVTQDEYFEATDEAQTRRDSGLTRGTQLHAGYPAQAHGLLPTLRSGQAVG